MRLICWTKSLTLTTWTSGGSPNSRRLETLRSTAWFVLLRQKHQTNVARLVNNPLFLNHADTVPELVVLLEDNRNNQFNHIYGDDGRFEVCDAALTQRYFAHNLYIGQSLVATVAANRQKCYTEYIYVYCVDDMAETLRMFGESVDAGGLHPALDGQGEDRRDDKHADVCPG